MYNPLMATQSVSLKLDLRIVSVVLLLVIAVMLALWRPWQGTSDKRVVSVTGEARIDAVPDEYVFSPYFQSAGTDNQALRNELAKLGDKLVKELRALGVPENKISLSGSSYDYYYYTNDKGEQTAQLRATVTVDTKELAQKVQDYLLKQDIKGQLDSSGSILRSSARRAQDPGSRKSRG